MSLNDQDLRAIAYLTNRARPSWGTAGIMAALDKVRDRDLAAVVVASLRATRRQDQHTPAVIAADGKHWADDPHEVPTRTPQRFDPTEFRITNPAPADRRSELIAQAKQAIRKATEEQAQ